MHGGPLKPSVHLFSFRDLVQRKRKNKGGRISCTKLAPATGEETHGTWCKGNEGTRDSGFSCTKSPRPAARHAAPPPAHAEVYKLPYDNKSVLKGNFFCGIILSPERNQRCNTGNNMKGDAI